MSSLSGDPHTIDLRGETCPFTFVRARLALEQLPLGARLRVLVDHEPATRNVPRSAVAWGQEIGPIEGVEPGVWSITLIKRAP
jgi:tRNA 2-thiouridine synthesizing protein A